MTAHQEPHPWEVVSYLSRQLAVGWYLHRTKFVGLEWQTNAAGRHKRCKSERGALAAIARLAGGSGAAK